ncbi:MAG: TonB-dependent receptor plug domain-containing protein [Flavobacteriales bacterium]
MKKYILFVISFLFAQFSIAQTITVKDHHTQLPIEGVFLISNLNSASIITNARGEANIELLKNQEYIEVLALGYKTIVTSYQNIENNGYTLELESSNMSLDEVVISATRSNQVNSNIPSKIISIKQADIALLNPQTAADLLGGSGKVFIQKSQQGGGSPMIRGFATNRLIYTVDGIRMNTAIFRAGNIQNVISLDPFATEKAEVLFGPGSVIYGSDAIGGVMSFQTLTPELSATEKTLVTGKAVMRYSSANQENTGHFDVNVGWKKWAFVTSFSAWDFDNLRQGSHGPDEYIKPIYVQRQDSIDRIITQDDPLLQIPSAYSQVNMMQKAF